MAVIYRPKHERQIKPSDKYGRYNCGAVATAIAIDRATLGGCMVNGEDVRAHTNEPIPEDGSPGLNIPQLVDAAGRMGVVLTGTRGGVFDVVLDRLGEGRGVILSGAGAALGAGICQPGFVGGHAVFLNNLNTAATKILLYNPLCLTYRWTEVATVKRYAEAFAVLAGGLAYASTRVTPNVPKNLN